MGKKRTAGVLEEKIVGYTGADGKRAVKWTLTL
jgi:hypothetical protein